MNVFQASRECAKKLTNDLRALQGLCVRRKVKLSE